MVPLTCRCLEVRKISTLGRIECGGLVSEWDSVLDFSEKNAGEDHQTKTALKLRTILYSQMNFKMKCYMSEN